MNIIIVDYEAGNVKSIANMLDFLGAKFKISDSAQEILNAKAIIFPGQGHFEQAVNNLKNKGLIEPIKQVISKNIPFLGICLGLQILFEESEEAPNVDGLGILKGRVKKFNFSRNASMQNVQYENEPQVNILSKIPQIGWNKITTTNTNSFLKDEYFYFVNSYYVEPADKNIIASTCDYGVQFCSSVQKDNLVAVQFHPEKSSEAGMDFFKRWISSL